MSDGEQHDAEPIGRLDMTCTLTHAEALHHPAPECNRWADDARARRPTRLRKQQGNLTCRVYVGSRRSDSFVTYAGGNNRNQGGERCEDQG